MQEARENEKKLRGERAQLEEEKKEIELTVQRKLDEERKATMVSNLLVVLCSEHSMASMWCFAEIIHAESLGKPTE